MSAAELGYLADVAWNCSIKAKTNVGTVILSKLLIELPGMCKGMFVNAFNEIDIFDYLSCYEFKVVDGHWPCYEMSCAFQ